MNLNMLCTGYCVERYPDTLTKITVDFVLDIDPFNNEDIADALRRIELYLSEKVSLVKSTDRPRCFYCGTLNDANRTVCSQCGASL